MPQEASSSIFKRAWLLMSLLGAAALLALALLAWSHHRTRFPRLSTADAPNWRSFGGEWRLADGIYTNRAYGRGDKLLGGPTTLGNYTVAADMRFDTAPEDPSFGDAGLLLRVLDPAIGVDAFRGFYIALRRDDHALVIGTMAYTYRELATAPFPHELRPGHWYHLSFSALGCSFHARAEDVTSHDAAELSYVEQKCSPDAGQIGLRSYYAKTSWRDLRVTTP